MVDYLLDLDGLRFPDNNRISDLDNHWNLSFNHLDYRFFNNFLYLHDSFMNNWYLNNSLDLFRNFLVYFYNFGNNFFNLFDSVYRYNLFDHNFHCEWSINSVGN